MDEVLSEVLNMNRFKRYVRKKGIKLEIDYPWLPYELKMVSIEAVYVNSEHCYVTQFTTVGDLIAYFHRDGTITYDFN